VRARRNWPALTGFGLGLLAVIGYFALIVRHQPALTRFLELPVFNLALIALGLVLSYIGLRGAWAKVQRFRGRVVAALLGALNLTLATTFCIYLFILTNNLPVAANAPAVGTRAPVFTLPDETGRATQLVSQPGRKTLLVFYRGFW